MHGLSLEVKYFLRVCRAAKVDVTGMTFKPVIKALDRKYCYMDRRMNILCFVVEQMLRDKNALSDKQKNELIHTLALTLYQAAVECRVDDSLLHDRIAKNYHLLYNEKFCSKHTNQSFYSDWIITFKDRFLLEDA